MNDFDTSHLDLEQHLLALLQFFEESTDLWSSLGRTRFEVDQWASMTRDMGIMLAALHQLGEDLLRADQYLSQNGC